MANGWLTYSFGLALVAASCTAPLPALALSADADLQPLYERLDTMSGIDAQMETDVYDLSQEVVVMSQEVRETREIQQDLRDKVQAIGDSLSDSALTLDEHEGLKKLSEIDETLDKIQAVVAPEIEGEVEGETEGEADSDTEDVPQTVPATLDDVARLLMINTATLAILLGVEVWRPLYDVLAGG